MLMSRTILKSAPPPYTKTNSSPMKDELSLDWWQLQELLELGKEQTVQHYVKNHYLGSHAQTWLMRTRNISLIKTYLQHHPEAGLFEDAEDMLIALRNKDCCLIYINNRPLRHHSLLILFAEQEIDILQAYLTKHPETSFSKLELILMFETKNLALIQQYIQLHPEITKDENCKEKLKQLGLATY